MRTIRIVEQETIFDTNIPKGDGFRIKIIITIKHMNGNLAQQVIKLGIGLYNRDWDSPIFK